MTEIQKLVEETFTSNEAEEQQIFEKCLKLVGSNRTEKENELGFCLLARMIEKSSAATLRLFQSRLANRFAQVSDKFTFCGGLFVRELLIKNPQAGELHSIIVSKIMLNCIDAAVQSKEPIFRELAAEIFALRISKQNLNLALNTLNNLLANKKAKHLAKDILELKTFGISSHRNSLTKLLFECLAVGLNSVLKKGISINRYKIIQVIEKGIQLNEPRSIAFACLRSLCVNAKYSIIPMLGRIVSSLIGSLEKLDDDLIRTLSFISSTFGPITSTLYRHFYVIFTALKQPLHLQSYGEDAANLLENIIVGASFLIKPAVFLTVQKSVCESSIRFIDSSIYLQLLSAFMALNNELVPSPLNIARTVSTRTRSNCVYARRLQMICDVAGRPKIANIADSTKKTLCLKEIQEVVRNEKKEKLKENDEDIVILDDVDDVDDDIVEIEDDEEEEKEAEEIEDETVAKRKLVEDSPKSEIAEKKIKVSVPEIKTTLLEGEASVDDILNLFDPS